MGIQLKDAQYETVMRKVETTQGLSAQTINVRYTFDSDTPVSTSEVIERTSRTWEFNLTQDEPVMPGTIVLEANDELWFDNKAGQIVREYSTRTGVGSVIGSIEYETGSVVIDDYPGRPATAQITPVSVVVGDEFNVILSTVFRTSESPLRPSGFTLRADDGIGGHYTATDDGEGNLIGDAMKEAGEIDLDDGLIYANFAVPMDAASLFYNAVSYKSVPLSSSILGLDPVRLPTDGRVPIFQDADILVITHTQKDEIAAPNSGLVIESGRSNLHDFWIEDSNGTRLKSTQVSYNKESGIATLSTPFSAISETDEPLSEPIYLVHRIDDMALCTEARIDGNLTLAQSITHSYPAGAWVASAVHMGNLQARVKNLRASKTDVGYDQDGIDIDARYNEIAYPIAIDNRGSVPDRWKIKFTSTTAFNLYSLERGLVATGTTVVDFSPTNPQTNTPYFTIKSDGWGTGWQVGNVVLFDTNAAASPLWLIRTVLPGQATADDDQIKLELRGDHN